MKLIIDIPDEEYKDIKDNPSKWERYVQTRIGNGIPCDTSGDLISREALIKWIDDSVSQYGHTYSTDMLNMWGLFKDYLINNVPTIEVETCINYKLCKIRKQCELQKAIEDCED